MSFVFNREDNTRVAFTHVVCAFDMKVVLHRGNLNSFLVLINSSRKPDSLINRYLVLACYLLIDRLFCNYLFHRHCRHNIITARHNSTIDDRSPVCVDTPETSYNEKVTNQTTCHFLERS